MIVIIFVPTNALAIPFPHILENPISFDVLVNDEKSVVQSSENAISLRSARTGIERKITLQENSFSFSLSLCSVRQHSVRA